MADLKLRELRAMAKVLGASCRAQDTKPVPSDLKLLGGIGDLAPPHLLKALLKIELWLQPVSKALSFEHAPTCASGAQEPRGALPEARSLAFASV